MLEQSKTLGGMVVLLHRLVIKSNSTITCDLLVVLVGEAVVPEVVTGRPYDHTEDLNLTQFQSLGQVSFQKKEVEHLSHICSV